MPITRATNLAGLGTIFDSLTDGGGLSVSGISTFTDLNITRVNITGVGTISNGSITNLTGTSSTITTLRSTTLNADTGNIVTGVTTNFTSTNGSITNLTGTSSTITTLRSTTGNFTTGNIVTGVTTNFNSTNVVITGVTTVSAGTTALPSISPSGDPNTGIFFPAADTIAFGEGGSEVVRIDSSGRVGINSTSPERKLDVVDSGANGSVIRSRVTTNNGGYLAYEALNSSGTSTFSVNHNGGITLAGNVIFASGQGLDFSATANSSGTMTNELLDDYEVGTWTPSMGTDASNTVTHTNQIGRYVKIGGVVWIEAYVSWSAWTGSGNVYITSLPFNLRTSAGPAASAFPIVSSPTSAMKNYQFHMDSANANTTTMYLSPFEDNSFTTIATIGTNSRIVIRGHYYIS